MQFTIYGVRYDTADMKAFPTGDPNQPTIYIDRNSRVFVEDVDDGKAVIRWVCATQIKALAGRYGISELERRVPNSDSPDHDEQPHDDPRV